MKVKTSISISQNILHEIDKRLQHSITRSYFIETVLREYLERNKETFIRNRRDLELLNHSADSLNTEAEDVLSYQAEI